MNPNLPPLSKGSEPPNGLDNQGDAPRTQRLGATDKRPDWGLWGSEPQSESLPGRYRTIVADPPWDYSKDASLRFAWRRGLPSGDGKPLISYQTLSVEEICALPIADLAERDAHLYLWTTNRYLWDSPRVVSAWGFTISKVLVWCKPPTGFALGGTYGSACEFVVFARRGSLKPKQKTPRDWFEWPRKGGHSAKPEAFLDLIESVSPGPYLELFARRNRLGWDTWGNEAIEHIDLEVTA